MVSLCFEVTETKPVATNSKFTLARKRYIFFLIYYIDFKIFFWANIREWIAVKSDTISAIDIAFKKNNIEIPFPQQDLHIRSVVKGVEDNKEKKEKDANDDNNTKIDH